jgi:protein KTI12
LIASQLILISGLPCSGKTHRAQQLAAEFSARVSTDPALSRLRVKHLASHHASADPATVSGHINEPVQTSLRDQIYTSAKEEKTARAEEFSAIKRALSKDVIVIADGLNYIKGYRYQIWCEVKAAETRCCVVHVAAREDECKAWNDDRLKAAGQEDEIEVPENDSKPSRGKNGVGEILPESHTAIYGDRNVASTSRSRSSSMGGASDDEEKPQAEDTMTLKSLYIRDRPNNAQYEEKEDKPRTAPLPSQPTHLTPETPHASADPPPPSSSHPYATSTLTSLTMRYEPPSPFSRWDTPLFTIPTSDPHPPYTPVWEALFPPPNTHKSKKALSQSPSQPTPLPSNPVIPNAATTLPSASPASALQTLESTTQLVATALLAAYRRSPLAEPGNQGGALTFVVDGLSCEIDIPPGLMLSQPMLQRLRRKYTGLQRGGIAHGVGSVGGGRRGVVEGFVGFLGREWGEE